MATSVSNKNVEGYLRTYIEILLFNKKYGFSAEQNLKYELRIIKLCRDKFLKLDDEEIRSIHPLD